MMGAQYTLPRIIRIQQEKARARFKLVNFRNVSLTFIGALCLGWFIIWLLRIFQNINQPQIEYSEGFQLYVSHLFGSGQWSWNILQPNGGYMVSFYTPVFYWTLAALGNLFGYSLFVGRLLVLSVFAVCMVLIYLIVHRLTGKKVFAVLAALFPLTQPFVNTWSMFLRVDFMAITFELAGFYIALRYWRSKWLYLSLVFFALAFYSKQSTLAAAGAVCLYALIKNWRFAIVYTSLFLGIIGIPLLMGSILTHGAFFREIFTYQQVVPTFRPMSEVQGYLTVGYMELFPLVAITIWYAFKNLKSLPMLFACLALLVNLIIVTRPGGAQNYFFEVIVAMSIVAGIALPEVIKQRAWGLVVAFLVVLWSLSFNYQLNLYPGPQYDQNVRAAESLIQDATYPIFTENADIVLEAGKVPYDEPFVFGQLPKFGYWDENLLLNDMKSGRMEYVITQYKMPSTAAFYRVDTQVQQAIVGNYHIVLDDEDKIGYGFVVYKTNKGGN